LLTKDESEDRLRRNLPETVAEYTDSIRVNQLVQEFSAFYGTLNLRLLYRKCNYNI